MISNGMKKIKTFYYTLILFGILGPKVVFGEVTGSQAGVSINGGIGNPIGTDSIQGLVSAILDVIVAIGTPIAVVFLIFSGFKFVFARGNSSKLTEARETFIWTIVGIVILLGARLLSEVVKGTVEQLGAGIL